MAKRLINTERGARFNETERIEVIDLYGSGPDLDYRVEIASPGIEISYDGNVDEHTEPIMGSSANFTVFLTPQQRDVVMGVMYGNREYALAVGYYIGDALEWAGLVLPENTTETIEHGSGFATVSFSCTDGLPFLKQSNFLTPDSTPAYYSGEW